jgi:signal transduction histidine kinase
VTIASAGGYGDLVSKRVVAERLTLASRWLARLNELLTVKPNDVFPSDQLLDHIPVLISEIAGYLRAPEEEEIAANAAVIDKARELGRLRHQQRASVHQLLREYEILEEILEQFIVDETAALGLTPTSAESFEVLRRLTRSTRTLMRTTVETFISEYTTTIDDRNQRMKTFDRMASHELRSPIGTIMFAASVLDNDAVRGDAKRITRVAQTIRSNAERLSWLVANLERLAKLNEALDGPSEQHVELQTVAGEVARQLEEMACSRNVAIRLQPRLPSLFVDPARVELVLLNLVSNAIKYSDPAKPDAFVEIGSMIDSANPDACEINVRDNGLGIPEAHRDAVFDRFFRAHAHLDTEHGVSGTGLGLAIVADCVRALSGSIRCESTTGEGTTFYLTLPRRKTAADPASA